MTHLLTLASEEAIEVAKELLKCVRFTPHDSLDGVSNIERVNNEFSDLIAILELLEEHEILIGAHRELIDKKKERLKHWMAVSDRLRNAATN